MNKFFQNAKRGFTLVELLIVIIIIAVLAGVVLITLDPAEQRVRAGATTLKSNVSAICRAQALCMVEADDVANCAAFGDNAVEIADPTDNPVGSTYVFGNAAANYNITGTWLQSATTFTMTCDNMSANKGEVECANAGGTYTCAGFGL